MFSFIDAHSLKIVDKTIHHFASTKLGDSLKRLPKKTTVCINDVHKKVSYRK